MAAINFGDRGMLPIGSVGIFMSLIGLSRFSIKLNYYLFKNSKKAADIQGTLAELTFKVKQNLFRYFVRMAL